MTDALHDPQAFLAAVVNSDDPQITIRERIDALKLLDSMGGLPDARVDLLTRQAAEATDEELDQFTDLEMCDVLRLIHGEQAGVVWMGEGDPLKRWPLAVAAFEFYIERKAKALAVELCREGGVADARGGRVEPSTG